MSSGQANQGCKRSRWGETRLSRAPGGTRRFWTLAGAASLILLIGFLAGSHYSRRPESPAGACGRTAVYYVDPMNPAHTSPVPGLAPCGMKMEPVYADEVGAYSDGSLALGTVRVTPRKQQLIGVRSAPVEKAPFTYTFRALGKVAVDETRIYRLNAAIDGWIREVGDNTTGSVVQKGETLAEFYSPEFLAAQQAYIYAVSALDRFQASDKEPPSQLEITRANIQQYVDILHNLGMSDQQIQELGKTRQYTESIRMVAPATSYVLARNISSGQRFANGTEWYRLADLSRIWVLVDLYENEADFVRPGAKVLVRQPYQRKVFQGTVSRVLPQIDPATRTLRVRLEVDNPDFALLPDMFMDVDFSVNCSETLNIPADAILDSGLRKTVFVDRGEGFFEPRVVETGWRLGDRAQILKGLAPGDKIVVSGNFLIDSESRMKLAAAGLKGDIVNDVVCSKLVDERQAEATGRSDQYQGKSYFFCSESCLQQFQQDPGHYVGPTPAGPIAAAPSPATVPSVSGEPMVAGPVPGWKPPVRAPVRPLTGPTIPRGPEAGSTFGDAPAETTGPQTASSPGPPPPGGASQECCELPHPAAPGTPLLQPGMPVHPQVIRQVPPARNEASKCQ
jgi:membrane fusion protein, copper/silver efflux system